jgi:hypothetical protein
MILFGENSLRNAIRELVAQYHSGGNHQGLDNRFIISSKALSAKAGYLRTRQRLGGMLNYYYRETA